jgi:hypothetical protein
MDSCDKHRNDEVGGYNLNIFGAEITLPLFISSPPINHPPAHRFVFIELKPNSHNFCAEVLKRFRFYRKHERSQSGPALMRRPR